MSDEERTNYAEIAAQVYDLTPEMQQNLIDPLIAFYEGVNVLRDDQKLHLVTMYQYSHALTALSERDEVIAGLVAALTIAGDELECVADNADDAEMARDMRGACGRVRAVLADPRLAAINQGD